MTGNYGMTWNAWRVWLHPRQAYDTLEDYVNMQADLEKQIAECLALLERQRLELARLTEETERLTRSFEEKELELGRVRKDLEDTRRQLRDAREELLEQEEIDRQMREFDAMLTKVEDMKRNYEKRIYELESMLRDTIQRRRREADNELLDPTDPESLPLLKPSPIVMSGERHGEGDIDDIDYDDDAYPSVAEADRDEVVEDCKDDVNTDEDKPVRDRTPRRKSVKIKPRDIRMGGIDTRRNVEEDDWLLDLPEGL